MIWLLVGIGVYLTNIIVAALVLGFLGAGPHGSGFVRAYETAPRALKEWGVVHQMWSLALWWRWRVRKAK